MSIEDDVKALLDEGRSKAQSELFRGRASLPGSPKTEATQAAAAGAAAMMVAEANSKAILRLAAALARLERAARQQNRGG